MKQIEAKQFLPLIQAWSEGKEIQMFGYSENDWIDCTEVAFCDPPSKYRIKPTPRLRPWRPEEVPLGAIARRKDNPAQRTILVGISEKGIYGALLCASRTEDVMNLYEHSTDGGKNWLPCGVME